MDLEKEERNLERWPRRLLYIPTLTSYEWQPGHEYNGVKEPKYNALTYTWGRWMLSENMQRDVSAIPITIHGDEWPIPRIDPNHFTVEEFVNVIKAVAGISTKFGRPRVDFIWLDIACINQKDPHKSAAEIGRQAVIFHGANDVCVWLTTHRELNQIVDDIWESGGLQPSDLTPYLTQSIASLRKLLSDPWFSSLWTLQEAFLRNDAYFLSQDAQIAFRQKAHSRPDIYKLADRCESLVRSANRMGLDTMHDDVRSMMTKSGLGALRSKYEIDTYLAAQARTASRREDRIYGIQQVFGLRLGNTAISTSDRILSFTELEIEFYEALLTKYPIQSQMHVFTKHVPVEHRWRVNPCSRLLDLGSYSLPRILDDAHDDERKPKISIRCAFSVNHSGVSSKPVVWSGVTVPLAHLKEQWDRISTTIYSNTIEPGDDDPSLLPLPLFISLDIVDELHDAPGSGPESSELINWLAQTFPAERLHVLLLGFNCLFGSPGAQTRFEDTMYGLLILHQHDKHWARLGVCQWRHQVNWRQKQAGLQDEDRWFLQGQGGVWEPREGILGYAG